MKQLQIIEENVMCNILDLLSGTVVTSEVCGKRTTGILSSTSDNVNGFWNGSYMVISSNDPVLFFPTDIKKFSIGKDGITIYVKRIVR